MPRRLGRSGKEIAHDSAQWFTQTRSAAHWYSPIRAAAQAWVAMSDEKIAAMSARNRILLDASNADRTIFMGKPPHWPQQGMQ